MSIDEITKEIIVAMIQKGTLCADTSTSHEQYPERQAKAVAAAYEIVYAGVFQSYNKLR